jgi:hypothetical protein
MTMIARGLALLTPLLFCSGPVDALVGADFVDLSVQRFTVAVRSTKGSCTGVVLAQDIVLTAAHCARDAPNLWVGGDRGWGDLSNPPVGLSPVREAVAHPRFDPGQRASPDIALLKLEKPLPDRFLPAFIGAPIPEEGENLIAVGYGESMPNDPTGGSILRMVILRVARQYSGYLLLAGVRQEDSGSGRGDSGGPVFTYRAMYGLVAVIVGHAERSTIAIAIAPNYAWIKETMEKLGARS